MKKIVLFAAAALALTACGHEYYHGDSRYVQYSEDCHYSFSQRGGNFKADGESVKMKEDKKIVYRDASCREIMNRDMGKATIDNSAASNPAPVSIEWKQPAPVVQAVKFAPTQTKTTYRTRRYVIVPSNY